MNSALNSHATKPAASLQELIEAAQAGSSDARGRAIQACWNYLISVARQELAGDLQARAGASDMVQDAFVYANASFNKFRGRDHAQLQAWIRQILLYRISRFRRDQRSMGRNPRREVRIDDSRGPFAADLTTSDQSCCTKLIHEERIARLRCAIDGLKPHHRELIVLRGLKRLSVEEIARRQNRTPEAVTRAWFRAVKRLCEEFNRLGGSTSGIRSVL